jgi:protein MpaA
MLRDLGIIGKEYTIGKQDNLLKRALNFYLKLLTLMTLASCSGFYLFSPLETQQIVPEKITEKTEKKVKEVIVVKDPQPSGPYFPKNAVRRHHTRDMIEYCQKIDKKFLHWGWGLSGCRDFAWHHVRDSVKGDPLMWSVFGDESAHKVQHQNMTFIMCGVHGDEITPIKFCFDILHYLNKNYAHSEFKDSLVLVFPIANPDSFFIPRPSRTNSRGVDINRNLPTKDWSSKALSVWKNRYRSDPRRYPGPKALSEPESLTQVNMIHRYNPDKIISVHAPLTILDYDGPVEMHNIHGDVGASAGDLLVQMSQKASDYEIRNYPFFPGSLGNYAGNERGIPTYTLELPSSDNRKHKEYWKLFKKAIHLAITHDLSEKDPTVESAMTPLP